MFSLLGLRPRSSLSNRTAKDDDDASEDQRDPTNSTTENDVSTLGLVSPSPSEAFSTPLIEQFRATTARLSTLDSDLDSEMSNTYDGGSEVTAEGNASFVAASAMSLEDSINIFLQNGSTKSVPQPEEGVSRDSEPLTPSPEIKATDLMLSSFARLDMDGSAKDANEEPSKLEDDDGPSHQRDMHPLEMDVNIKIEVTESEHTSEVDQGLCGEDDLIETGSDGQAPDETQQEEEEIRIVDDIVQPLGIPAPTTYAEVANLAMRYPEHRDAIVNLPLGRSKPRSVSPGTFALSPSANVFQPGGLTPSPEPPIQVPKKREVAERPNWAAMYAARQSVSATEESAGRGGAGISALRVTNEASNPSDTEQAYERGYMPPKQGGRWGSGETTRGPGDGHWRGGRGGGRGGHQRLQGREPHEAFNEREAQVVAESLLPIVDDDGSGWGVAEPTWDTPATSYTVREAVAHQRHTTIGDGFNKTTPAKRDTHGLGYTIRDIDLSGWGQPNDTSAAPNQGNGGNDVSTSPLIPNRWGGPRETLESNNKPSLPEKLGPGRDAPSQGRGGWSGGYRRREPLPDQKVMFAEHLRKSGSGDDRWGGGRRGGDFDRGAGRADAGSRWGGRYDDVETQNVHVKNEPVKDRVEAAVANDGDAVWGVPAAVDW